MIQKSSSNSGQNPSVYDENSIVHLDPREHVRKRPGMYIGGTDVRALNHMIYEVIDSALDDVAARTCDKIAVTLLPDNVVIVEDNAPSISVAPHRPDLPPTLELIMTNISMKRSDIAMGGLYGVGIFAVNALCQTFHVDVRSDEGHYRQEYSEGIAQSPVTRIGDATPDEYGNTFTFRPDFTIMDRVDFDADALIERGKVLAATFPGLRITVTDQRGKDPIETMLHAPNGMADYLSLWMMPDNVVGKILSARGAHSAEYVDLPIDVQVALQWHSGTEIEIVSFASTLSTPDHGTHVRGFERWMSENPHIRPTNANGYIAIISVNHPSPQYVGCTRMELMNSDATDAVYGVLTSQHGTGTV